LHVAGKRQCLQGQGEEHERDVKESKRPKLSLLE
jgi:hypothetical protein